jgi:hypothetical protein
VAEAWAAAIGGAGDGPATGAAPGPAPGPAPCPSTGPYLRLSPAVDGTDGFFVAVLARRVDAAGTPPDGGAGTQSDGTAEAA